MKKIVFLLLIVCFSCLTSCKNTEKKEPELKNDNSTETIEIQEDIKILNETSKDAFNINTIPISESELGDFPFFSLPDGLKEQNKPVKRSYDKLYFPIDGVMTPLEGKVWKSSIVKTDESDEDWSLPYFENSYDNAITAIGGVKIFDGEITNEEYNSYRSKATYLGEEGSMGYAGQTIKVYLIRRSNGDDIYIQLTGNSAYGKLNILQKAPFKQTITMLKSDQIQKDLNDKGKIVLYINFETDKATLQEDGKDAVSEISKALKSDKNLNISINGYTDNVGNEAHNLKLSKDRADTVKNAIIASGIDSNRLTSDGFGSKDPIANNDTEAGRTKNRRVELLKN